MDCVGGTHDAAYRFHCLAETQMLWLFRAMLHWRQGAARRWWWTLRATGTSLRQPRSGTGPRGYARSGARGPCLHPRAHRAPAAALGHTPDPQASSAHRAPAAARIRARPGGDLTEGRGGPGRARPQAARAAVPARMTRGAASGGPWVEKMSAGR